MRSIAIAPYLRVTGPLPSVRALLPGIMLAFFDWGNQFPSEGKRADIVLLKHLV
jgi:hypothetical protein